MNKNYIMKYGMHSLLVLILYSQVLIGLPTKFERKKPEQWQESHVQISAKSNTSFGKKKFWDCCLISESDRAQLKRSQVARKATSLIIPCHYKHAHRLYELLSLYENQTLLPDEVVISLSEVQLVDAGVLERLCNERWAFPITLVVTEDKKFAGENRNIACQHAKGELFICQDADDIPHPQRVEIIHYLFATYDIDHLMHEFITIEPENSYIMFQKFTDFQQLRLGRTKDFEAAWKMSRFTNGNIGITKHLFDTIQWTDKPRGQDTEFNKNVYGLSDKCMIVGAALYGYCRYLSSAPTPEQKAAHDLDVCVEVLYTKEQNKQFSVKLVELKKQ